MVSARTRRTLVAMPAISLTLLAGACGGDDAQGELILATTTSTQDSGLLDELVPAFEEQSGYKVKTVAVGTGQALELGEKGEADVLLVHAPASEHELVAKGATGRRLLVMHNDFLLVGPKADPAGARGRSPTAALTAIAGADAPFVSRGDDSGTHELELKLWQDAGVEPAGKWYEESGQGMGATLQIADQKGAYTIVDRATYLSSASASRSPILVEGDASLLNVYHVIEMTRKAGERVNEDAARAFADYVVSPEAQELIGAFGVEELGQQLFVPDAGKAEDALAPAA
jgi:tungstate transport system substrate-binding protein